MPANLTPQYLEAEAKFKQAKSVPEKIKALELMMAIIPKHKGTERLRGQLKSRMAKLKEELQRKPAVSRAEQAYNVKKERAAQVVLLGLPNAGKSNLFTHLTHAASEVADYPFTTQKPIPGMMRYENLQIQLVDTPAIQMDHIEPGFPNLIRNANGLLIVLDLTDDPVFQMEVIVEELNRMKLRVGDRDPTDSLEQGWVFKKAFLIGNKVDLRGAMDGFRTLEARFKNEWMILPVSAKEKMNFEEVKKEVYCRLDILRAALSTIAAFRSSLPVK